MSTVDGLAFAFSVFSSRISKTSHLETRFHEKCVKEIESIEEHAKCVSELLDISRAQLSRQQRGKELVKQITENASADWVGAFRIRKKRETRVVTRDGYEIKSGRDGMSPFTMITKQITKTIRALKNKKEPRRYGCRKFEFLNFQIFFSWREIMVDVKKTGEVMEKRKKVKEMLGKSVRSRSPKSRKILLSPRKPLASSWEESGKDDPIQMRNQIIDDNDSDKKIDIDEMFKRFQDHPEQILNEDAPKILNMTGEETEAVTRIKMIREGN